MNAVPPVVMPIICPLDAKVTAMASMGPSTRTAPGWVLTPLVQQQIDARIAAGASPEQARHDLLAEKQPSLDFVTADQLGELALFLCSEAAAQVRGAAWNMDGGWVAQ